jgi:hypothetical protein
MTDITRHNAKVHVFGQIATNTTNAVAAVFPQMMALEGAIVTATGTSSVAVKTAISGITLTMTPSGSPGAGGSGYYYVEAWGY